jgi:hypothetical protein
VLDLAFLDQVLHRASDVFDRHVRINTVLVEQGALSSDGLSRLIKEREALSDEDAVRLALCE